MSKGHYQPTQREGSNTMWYLWHKTCENELDMSPEGLIHSILKNKHTWKLKTAYYKKEVNQPRCEKAGQVALQGDANLDKVVLMSNPRANLTSTLGLDNSGLVYFNVFFGSRCRGEEGYYRRCSDQSYERIHRLCASTATDPRRWTTRMPELTRPKIVCFESK